MAVDALFEQALAAADRIGELRRLVQRLLNEGASHASLLEKFEQVRQRLREAGRDDDEDAIMDVMDFLNGWCSPHARIGDPLS